MGYLERGLSKILWKFNLFSCPPPDYFSCLNSKTEGGFRVFPEIEIGNLCKSFHDDIIISFSTFSWNHKALDKEENLKNPNA